MRVDQFDFDLPRENIALRPVSPRDSAKLLHVPTSGTFQDLTVRELPQLLKSGDVLVFNDTKVIPAQLSGVRERDGIRATIQATLHMRTSGDRWKAFVRGAKKLSVGDQVQFGGQGEFGLSAEVSGKHGGEIDFKFDRTGADLDEALVNCGQVPLPPYISSQRNIDQQDLEDYQTIYAQEQGAVAAPTAGLHFTDQLFQSLDEAGVKRLFLTLHVGAGTFLPVTAENVDDHHMHSEWGRVSRENANALNEIKSEGGRIIPVGTTSLRLLESASTPAGVVESFEGTTDIFIKPGYDFNLVDGLMTNFHLPKSTLFMLVSALCGRERMLSAYKHAIANQYRFYSYGDASLLMRND